MDALGFNRLSRVNQLREMDASSESFSLEIAENLSYVNDNFRELSIIEDSSQFDFDVYFCNSNSIN
jgi:hypothetical protein